jgi:hypothetical protein
MLLFTYRKDHNKFQVNFSEFHSTYDVNTHLCSARDMDKFYKLKDMLGRTSKLHLVRNIPNTVALDLQMNNLGHDLTHVLKHLHEEEQGNDTMSDFHFDDHFPLKPLLCSSLFDQDKLSIKGRRAPTRSPSFQVPQCDQYTPQERTDNNQ